MLTQDENKANQNQRDAAHTFHEKPLWTSTQTLKILTSAAESMLSREMNQANNYLSIRSENNVLLWDVTCSDMKVSASAIPQLQRVCTVTVDNTGVMHCSCGFFWQNGIPCCHMCHVSLNYQKHFTWFSVGDVDVQHLIGYTLFLTVKRNSTLDENGKHLKNQYIMGEGCRLCKLVWTLVPKDKKTGNAVFYC